MLLLLALAALVAPAQVEPQLVYHDSLAPNVENVFGPERFWYSERSEWQFLDSVADDGLGNPVPDSGPCLTFKSTQRYRPRVRSPHSLAILRGVHLQGSHAFEVEAMQTGIETPHRDLVLVFGFESPEQYFYAHLGMVPDATSSNVFEVDEAPRRRVGEVGTRRIQWGRGVWHRLRVECNGKGRVRVFVDDLQTPHFEKDLGRPIKGQIGFGSFDDAGAFRNLKVWQSGRPGSGVMRDRTSSGSERDWKVSPFGGEAEAVQAARQEAEPHTLRLQVRAGRTPLWAMLEDVNKDGAFEAGIDRWMATDSPSRERIEPEFMLSLDEVAVIADRISVQPLLDPDGRFVEPYRFSSGIPAVSHSDFLKAQYQRHCEGHGPVGPWKWSVDFQAPHASTRPLLVALTPSDRPETWRWDAELFTHSDVAKRLAEGFTTLRRETSPRRQGSGLVPLDAVTAKGAIGESPMLLMYSAEGAFLGGTATLDSAESLLQWLRETERKEPVQRRTFHR